MPLNQSLVASAQQTATASEKQAITTIAERKCLVLIDGQNFFKTTQEIWGFNKWFYDPRSLAELACSRIGSTVAEVRMYTGVPKWDRDRGLRQMWERKCSIYRDTRKVHIETRELAYYKSGPVEKGIDVLIAVDLILALVRGGIDDIIVFSQDSDLSEAVRRGNEQIIRDGRVLFYGAFPYDETRPDQYTNHVFNDRPLKYTKPIRLSRDDVLSCTDEDEKNRKAANAAAYVKLEALSRRQDKVYHNKWDPIANGRYVRGTLAHAHAFEERGIVVIESAADRFEIDTDAPTAQKLAAKVGTPVYVRADTLAAGFFTLEELA